MIAFLSGKPLVVGESLIVVCNGVGYGVSVGGRFLAACQTAETVEVFTYTYVREDKLELYGFPDARQLELFKQILSVNGVGPRIALSLVDRGTGELVESVQNANLSFFTSVPRVGKKLAQKIIIDLKPKLGGLKDLDLTPLSQKAQDVYDALTSLGFEETSIRDVLDTIDVENQPLESIIKQSVKSLGKAYHHV